MYFAIKSFSVYRFWQAEKFRLKKKDLESSSPNVFFLLFTISFVQVKSFHNKSNSPRYKFKAFFFQIRHCLAYNLTRFTQRIIYENNVLECPSFTGKNAN